MNKLFDYYFIIYNLNIFSKLNHENNFQDINHINNHFK
jgi:hypothetical protein